MNPQALDWTSVSRPRSALARALALVSAGGLLGAAGWASTAMAQAPVAPTTAIQAGPVNLTFGGFTALESLYRSKNETLDIGSNFNTSLPFAYQANDHISEFRETARQSRFSLLAQGPQAGALGAEGYLETDFLSSGATSNSGESNSYTLRMRHFYGVLRDSASGWYLLAGQTWSLATLSTSGTLQPRAEQIPLTIDAQYVAGFNWTRNPQLRFVKLIGDAASFGVSLESPQASFTGPTPATSIINNTGGSTLNNTTSYSADFAPDVIAKFAVNPGWGHYEVFGMARGFRDRYEPTAGSVAGTNNTTWGESVGAGAILPLTSMLSFQASALSGDGIGRYGSAQLPDATVRPDGTIAAINETDVLAGLTLKPTGTMTLYLYGGVEQAQRTAFTGASGSLYGYGNTGYNNSGCNLVTGTAATCVANTKEIEQISLGDWWKVYQGQIGNFQIGLQYSYTNRKTFAAVGGAPSTNIGMGFVSFRFYPYQR